MVRTRVSFWQDVWWMNEALSLSFPGLFQIAIYKHAMVSDYLDVKGGVHWNPSRCRIGNWSLLTSCLIYYSFNGFILGWTTKHVGNFIMHFLFICTMKLLE